MKKFKNITIGGIQQKIFNLVLVTLLLMMAAITVVIIHQSGRLTRLSAETNEAQKASISNISEWTMSEVIDANLTQSTQLLFCPCQCRIDFSFAFCLESPSAMSLSRVSLVPGGLLSRN